MALAFLLPFAMNFDARTVNAAPPGVTFTINGGTAPINATSYQGNGYTVNLAWSSTGAVRCESSGSGLGGGWGYNSNLPTSGSAIAYGNPHGDSAFVLTCINAGGERTTLTRYAFAGYYGPDCAVFPELANVSGTLIVTNLSTGQSATASFTSNQSTQGPNLSVSVGNSLSIEYSISTSGTDANLSMSAPAFRYGTSTATFSPNSAGEFIVDSLASATGTVSISGNVCASVFGSTAIDLVSAPPSGLTCTITPNPIVGMANGTAEAVLTITSYPDSARDFYFLLSSTPVSSVTQDVGNAGYFPAGIMELNLTLYFNGSSPTGTYPVSVHVESSDVDLSTVHMGDCATTLNFTGSNPDFSLSCTPPSTTIVAGSNTSFNLSTTAVDGFNSAVTFSHSFNPNSGTLPSVSYVNNGAVPSATTTANITTSGSTTPAVYTITFTGNGGGKTHQCNVTLTVSPNPPPTGNIQCLDNKDYTDGPCAIEYSTPAVLIWTSANSTSCTVTPGGWTGTSNPEQYTGNLTSNTTFTLTCSGPGGTNIIVDTVDIIVGTPPAPTANILCNGTEGPCNIAYNGTATISWTSSNAVSCTATSPNPPNFNQSGLSNPGVSSGNITVNPTVFTLNCTGPGGNAQDTVTITVPSATFNLNCTPAYTSIIAGQSISYNINTTAVNGFNSPVTVTHSFDPDTPPLPNISYVNNGSVPSATITANITTNGSTVPDTYTIFFTANGGGVTRECDVTLNLDPMTITPPTITNVDNSAQCSAIDITWNTHGSHTNQAVYRVYRNSSNQSWPHASWVNTGVVVNHDGSTGSYTRRDTNPNPGSNYYRVTVSIGGSPETASSVSSPVSPILCQASTNGSYKRVVGVGSTPPTLPARCDLGGSQFSPGEGMVFKAGETVYFEICVINSGTETLTNVRVNEDAGKDTNLINTNFVNAVANCATPLSATEYEIGTMPPGPSGTPTTCSILVSSEIAIPSGPASSLYEFINFADIIADQGTAQRTVNIVPQRYSIGGAAPTRGESAP